MTASGTDTRTRILEAAVSCVERGGLARTSLEDVASEAGVSRATLYRWFEGGRDQLISETVAWEIGRFLGDLAEAVEPEPDLESKLVRGLVWGHRAVEEHALLQRILGTEPELLLHELQATIPVMSQLVQAYLAELLSREALRPGVDVTEASTYVAGMFLSYLGSRGGWDLTDDQAVRRLVRTQLLAGVLRAP
ncbi:MAG TPA: TetR/AcrR family transcriptional regulator [Acidimicrobiales bacterium]|nr:TetR/AcrR family transcriptional regulator [Acidimicrobiales bacterium]